MAEVFDLMSDRMMKHYADLKEHLEERTDLGPEEIDRRVQRLILGRMIKACIYYRRGNMARLSRRLGLGAETIRKVLNAEEDRPEVLAEICRDEVLDLKGWLTDMRDNHDWFAALIDEALAVRDRGRPPS